MAVALDDRAGRAVEPQREALLLGQRFVQLDRGADDRRDIEPLAAPPAGAGLGLGDAEQRVEGRQQPVGLLDRRPNRLALGGAVLRPEQRQFEPCPQPRERRLQIVGDVVGDLAHRGHQSLDLVEHPVQIGGELVEFVIGAGPRHPIRQVAGHDAFGGPVHLLDAAQHVAAHHRAAQHADRERDETRPQAASS